MNRYLLMKIRNTGIRTDAQRLEELCAACPLIQIKQFPGHPGRLYGLRNGEVAISIDRSNFRAAVDAFRTAYTKAQRAGVLRQKDSA